jgi:hypothetical protein
LRRAQGTFCGFRRFPNVLERGLQLIPQGRHFDCGARARAPQSRSTSSASPSRKQRPRGSLGRRQRCRAAPQRARAERHAQAARVALCVERSLARTLAAVERPAWNARARGRVESPSAAARAAG